jgi:alpha-mannosidase
MKKMIFFAVLAAISLSARSQKTVPYFGKINWVNGYSKEISGENIAYFSAYPDYATMALLTRTTDGKKKIEWETAPVPAKIKGPYVYFSWIAAHSTGTSKGNRNFDLYVNDEKVLTFTTFPNNREPVWSYGAADSSRIVFQETKLDGAYDAHGFAYLRLPLSRVTAGKPVRMKVVGQNQNSSDWYMTFMFSFEEKVEISPVPFILKDGNQSLAVNALHFGKVSDMTVTVNNTAMHHFAISEGINHFDVPVKAVQKPDSIQVQVFLAGKLFSTNKVLLQPVIPRTIYFIHHSHTDIGYSHLQPEVARIHIKNIDDALRMIEATKNYPEGSKFKWNIESLWAVENYLKQASVVQKEKFIAAIKEGSIGLSAMYANMLTGMSEPEEMFHYTDYAKDISKEFGITINSAMQSDVPGFAWTTVTALAKAGVKYFSSGPNYLGETHPFSGDRVGHFVKTWGDKPVWWASPSGEEKVLFWTGAKGYSSWHGTPPGGIFDRGYKRIAAYITELSNNNYPYDMVQWRYNVVSDNGPIDTGISRFVKAWNERYASPKIILSTTEEMFATFEKKYGGSIPVVKGDITPYWEDGAVSTAEEEGRNRVNSLRLQQLTTLYSLLNPQQYNAKKFYEGWKNTILFHEHTWGAHNSITQPDVPFVTEQWRIKKQFLLDADEEINALEKELLQPITDVQSKKIAVFNTTSLIRSEPVILPAGTKAKSVKDAAGILHPLQSLSNGRLVFIATDVPALGKALYELTGETAPQKNIFTLVGNALSNGKITVTWDSVYGSITALQTNNIFNYAGTFNGQGLNGYWYVPGLNPADVISNGKVTITTEESGPVVTTISIRSDAPGANFLERKISLYANGEAVMLENTIDKKAVRTKEGVHFSFPFNASLKHSLLDAGYGSMRYMADQLPGSNFDYLYGRRWLDVASNDKGIQMLWLQSPLVEPAAIIDERQTINQTHKDWKKEGTVTSTWFSYIMNNYWHTNYKADQEGISYYNYALRPHGMVNHAMMEQAAINFTQPLLALPVKADAVKTGSLFTLSNDRITVTSITPTGNSNYIVRLYNPEPVLMQTSFIWQDMKPVKLINKVTGKVIEINDVVNISAMGVMEIELVMRQ